MKAGEVTLKERKVWTLENFRGVDFSTPDVNVLPSRAAYCRNLINEYGVSRKRHGWRQLAQAPGRINGIFPYTNREFKTVVVYAGTQFFRADEAEDESGERVWTLTALSTPEGANLTDTRAEAFLSRGRMYLVGCGDYLVFGSFDDGESYELRRVEDDADTYIPVTTISINAAGASSDTRAGLDAVNLLSRWRKNRMRIDAAENEATAGNPYFYLDAPLDTVRWPDIPAEENGGFAIAGVNEISPVMVEIRYLDDGEEKTLTLKNGRCEKVRVESSSVPGSFHDKYTDESGTLYMVTVGEDGSETRGKSFGGIMGRGTDAERIAFPRKMSVSENGETRSVSLVTPIEGADNVTVTFSHREEGYAERVTQGSFGTLFGVNGNTDRLFLAGSGEFANAEFFSEADDFTYFPDLNTAVMGSENAPIRGFARLNDSTLCIFKQDSEAEATVFYQTGREENSYDSDGNISAVTAIFSVRAGSAGQGAVSPYAQANLNGDVLLLSSSGVYGVVLSSNVATQERYTRERSANIAEALRGKNLSDAAAVVHDGKYLLCLGEACFVADARYKFSREDDLNSSFQYEWWYWDNIPARVFSVLSGGLYFGSEDGRLCQFDEAFSDRVKNQVTAKRPDGESPVIVTEEPPKAGSMVKICPLYDEAVHAAAACVRDGKIFPTGEEMQRLHEGATVWADGSEGSGLSAGVAYTITDLDRGAGSFRLERGGEPVTVTGECRLFRDLSGTELIVIPAEGGFSLRESREGETIIPAWYPGGAAEDSGEEAAAWNMTLRERQPVTAEWVTPTLDMGTNLSSKTLLKMTIACGQESSGRVRFGYETRRGTAQMRGRGISPFSLTNVNFCDFTFESGFTTSYTVRASERNFNYIRFRFLSDDDQNCQINSFSAVYKINRANMGVR